jgi:hypothetical protein
MHLFAPERPEASPNRKAILLDGSAIPPILVIPQANGTIRAQVMLRCYDTHGGYRWHHIDVSHDELSVILCLFVRDPERVLKDYFGWTAQEPTKPMAAVKPRQTETTSYVDDLL